MAREGRGGWNKTCKVGDCSYEKSKRRSRQWAAYLGHSHRRLGSARLGSAHRRRKCRRKGVGFCVSLNKCDMQGQGLSVFLSLSHTHTVTHSTMAVALWDRFYSALQNTQRSPCACRQEWKCHGHRALVFLHVVHEYCPVGTRLLGVTCVSLQGSH